MVLHLAHNNLTFNLKSIKAFKLGADTICVSRKIAKQKRGNYG